MSGRRIDGRRREAMGGELERRDGPPCEVLAARELVIGRERLALAGWGRRLWRVTLFATPARLVEVALGADGRPGRVRQFALARLRLADGGREIAIGGNDGAVWRLSRPLDAEEIERLRQRAAVAPRPGAKDGRLAGESELCAGCLAPVSPDERRCAACGRVTVSPRLAGWLALGLPGAGRLYCGERRRAWARAAGETAVLVAAAAAWLLSSAWAVWLAALVVMPPLVAVIKAEAVLEARWLGRRRRASDAGRERRWSRLAVAGALLLVAALALPVLARGLFDGRVDRRLEIAEPTGWEAVERDGSPATWFRHSSGALARLEAVALPRGRPLPAARRALGRRLQPPVARLEPLTVGHHAALVGRAESDGRRYVHLLVIDRRHRDAHWLRLETALTETEGAEALELLSGLARGSYFQGL